MTRTSLREIARDEGTDKEGAHSYAEAYERHLGHLRGDRITLLEIGIGGYANPAQGGASLRMWKRFFPHARIFGLDIEDKSALAEDRITILQGDQGDREVLDRIAREHGPFDVIIDDGSHRCAHVINSFQGLFPHLTERGIYAIEDLQTSYWETYGGSSGADRRGTSMTMLQSLVDGLNHAEFDIPRYEPTYTDRHVESVTFYHNLAFIQKGANLEPSHLLPPHPREGRHFARPATARVPVARTAALRSPRRLFRTVVPLPVRRALVAAGRSVRGRSSGPSGPPGPSTPIDADPPTARVAIVVVSYNALAYARRMLRSVRRTTGVPYEIVVVDNASTLTTRLFWTLQRFLGRISRLALLDRNTFFAEGNNIGVAMAPRDATHLLLLNTDCEVLDPRWLERLLAVHREGATGLRYVTSGPWPRADGFCLLVDRHCWENGLDEAYQWWWSITGLEARLLRQGRSVQAVKEYGDVLVHHGGKSGKAFQAARSVDTNAEAIAGWFEGRQVMVVDRLPEVD